MKKGKRYAELTKLVDRTNNYDPQEAVALVKKLANAKFDETIEAHIRHGIRIPVLDENGNQKVGARNRKQWKRVLTDATGWNNPQNCELWRSEWANICNAHLKTENHIDHRSYARQGKLEIPTIHEGADARKIDEKFQNGHYRIFICNKLV